MTLNGHPRATFLKAISLVIDGEYFIDDENVQQIRDLVGYFSGTETNLDPKKSILLIGHPGSGKTLLMEVFAQLVRNLHNMSYKQTTCIDAAKYYSKMGLEAFNMWKGNWFFDDLFTEDQANHFGKREIMRDIIFYKYDEWRKLGAKMHMTTNYPMEVLEERYQPYCASRISQMCNIVGLGHLSDSTDRRQSSLPVFKFPLLPTFYTTDEDMKEKKELEETRERYENTKSAPAIPTPYVGSGTRLKEAFDNIIKKKEGK